jgi:hypothetical protein
MIRGAVICVCCMLTAGDRGYDDGFGEGDTRLLGELMYVD